MILLNTVAFYCPRQFGIPYGRRRGRIFEAIGHNSFVFPAPLEDGRLLAKTSLHARGCQFYIFERRNYFVPASDLLQRIDVQNGILAYSYAW